MAPVCKVLIGMFSLSFGLAAYAQEVRPDAEPVAQAQSADAQPQIIPGQPIRTARLFRFSGDVQVQRTDNTGGDTAVLNMPLTQGTRIMTGDSGQAEIEFDDGSVARLTPQTVVSIDSLADKVSAAAVRNELTVLTGLVYFELRETHPTDWGIQFGSVCAYLVSNSAFRVQVDQLVSTLSVTTGAMQVDSLAVTETPDAAFKVDLRDGESVKVDSADPSRYFLSRQIEPQSWDSWNQSRDEHAAESAQTVTAARNAYAANQAYGWSDLDNNGTWYSAPAPVASQDAGLDVAPDGSGDLVWQPTAAAEDADFDPYGDGAFVWLGGSYVWASAYAWGWTPYRCGEWEYYAGLGWVWHPNRFCLAFGYGGYSGVFLGHRHPPRYRPVSLPVAQPGPIHPIVRMKSPSTKLSTPHEATASPSSKIAHIAGRDWLPLQPLRPVTGGSVIAGPALYRDFPVETRTQKPILGSVAKPDHPTSDPVSTGWIAHEGTADSRRESAPARSLRTPSAGSEVRPAPAPAAQHPEHTAAPAPAPHGESAPSSSAKPK